MRFNLGELLLAQRTRTVTTEFLPSWHFWRPRRDVKTPILFWGIRPRKSASRRRDSRRMWRCLSHGVVAGGYLFTECVDSAAVRMRRRPIRFDWLDVASRDWLGGLLALAQAGCQASLRGNASLCDKQERKAEAGWEARYCASWTTCVVLRNGCGVKRTAPCYGTSVFSLC